MAHVEFAAGVGQHGAGVEFWLGFAILVLGMFRYTVGVLLLPLCLCGRFNFGGVVSFLHGLCMGWYKCKPHIIGCMSGLRFRRVQKALAGIAGYKKTLPGQGFQGQASGLI